MSDFDLELFRRPRRREQLSPPHLPPVVSIQRQGMLYLSRRVLALLHDPRAALLLFDRARRIIGIRPAAADHLDAYRLGGPPDRSSAYIVAKTFLDHYQIDYTITRHYECQIVENTLIVDLALVRLP